MSKVPASLVDSLTRPSAFDDHLHSPRTGAPETPVHEAADAHLSAVTASAMYAFAIARHSIDTYALSQAVANQDKAAAQAAMAEAPAVIGQALNTVLPASLARVYDDGTRAGLSMLEDEMRTAELRSLVPKLGWVFNIVSPEAIAWAKEHVTDLIPGISQATGDAITKAITAGLEGNSPRTQVIDDIMAAIGDVARADLIARTETMRAANRGLGNAWAQAREKGLLSERNQKQWIATGDDITCDECDELDGQTVSVDDDFSIGEDPPAHPNCRCTMGIVG